VGHQPIEKMYLSELSAKLNIPVKDLISFMSSRNIVIDVNTNLTKEEQGTIIKNVAEIRANVHNLNIKTKKLEGPKILVKIDLSAIDASTRPKKVVLEKTKEVNQQNISSVSEIAPHLMQAAKEFNIGLSSIVEYLINEGFDADELKSTSRMTEKMYILAKQHFNGNGSEAIQLALGKALVCLNVGVDTFIDTLKANNVEHTFKVIRNEIEPRSISLKPEALISLFKSDIQLSAYKGLSKVKVISKEGREQTLTVEPFPFDQWSIKQAALMQTGQYTNVSLPQIPFTDFASTFRMDHQLLRQKLRSNGFEYIKEGWNISQKAPLELFVIYLKIESQPIEPFLKCALSQKQKLLYKEPVKPIIISQTENINNKHSLTKKASMHFQKILFGSPGTGKSHTIDGSGNSYLRQLNIVNKSLDCIKTVFHPEYTYGDFMGKLMPNTNDDGGVEYRFYAGHFLKTLGRAYKNIILAKIEHEKEKEEVEKGYKTEINRTNKRDFSYAETEELQRRREGVPAPLPQNVALVIDEINRGNSAAIFGTTFQLLDRDANGWSSYHVRISDLENNKLLEEISLEYKEYKKGSRIDKVSYSFDNNECTETEYKRYLDFIFEDLHENEQVDLTRRDIKLPPNLSIIATMNTSDNSIYFMDSAFKRRWDWEFIDITSDEQKQMQLGRKLEDGFAWDEFVDNLNSFIKKYGERIRKIEDKQIGYYFIKGDVIKHEAIKNKLMFFLWDSIFNNDKKPLKELIGMDKTLVTFGDFIRHYDVFISAIKNKTFSSANVL
jgi:hypothetical protein